MKLRQCLFLSCLVGVQADSVQLLNWTATDYPDLSSTCLGVINQAVSCSPSLVDTTRYGLDRLWWYTDDWLAKTCTSTCKTSLATWLRRINGACGTQRIVEDDGSQVLPSLYAEYFSELYSEACVTSGSNSTTFCNAEARNQAGVDASNQNVTASPQPSYICSSCYLSLVATRLEMPLASNTDQASLWSTITSRCGVTTISLTTPTPTTWVIPASTDANSTATTTTSGSATPTCAGDTYTVQAGDDCHSVSKSQNIDTFQLLAANGLASYCYDFPQNGSLCIPSARQCTVHTVQANETCRTLAKLAGNDTTVPQIVSWNQEVGFDCNNIGSLVGFELCISVPGGRVNPVTTTDPASTTDASSTATTSLDWTPFTSFPAVSATSTATSTASNATAVPQATIAPLANGTRLDCYHYEQPPLLTNRLQSNTTSSCADAAAMYNITVDDLVAWNPSLNTSLAAGGGSCTLDNRYRYCVVAYATSANATDACDQWAMPMPGYTCAQFANINGVDTDQFVLWNPSVGADCSTFSLSTPYCVSVYGYRPGGEIATCNKWAMANNTDWTTQPCQELETEFGLSHARFVAWNPSVQDNCTGLYEHYEYCVSVPGFKPTYTTPVTSTLAPSSATASVSSSASSSSAAVLSSAATTPTTLVTSSTAAASANAVKASSGGSITSAPKTAPASSAATATSA